MAKKATAKKPKSSTKARAKGAAKVAPADEAQVVNDGRLEVVRGANVDLVGTFKCSTAAQVQTLAKGYNNLKKDAQGASGAISDMLSKAEETKHLNRPAFMIAMKFFNMSTDKLARVWPIFLKYADDLGVPQKATEQAELFAQGVAADAARAKQADIEDDEEVEAKDPGQEARAAAQGLSPSRRPSGLQIVPNGDDNREAG